MRVGPGAGSTETPGPHSSRSGFSQHQMPTPPAGHVQRQHPSQLNTRPQAGAVPGQPSYTQQGLPPPQPPPVSPLPQGPSPSPPVVSVPGDEQTPGGQGVQEGSNPTVASKKSSKGPQSQTQGMLSSGIVGQGVSPPQSLTTQPPPSSPIPPAVGKSPSSMQQKMALGSHHAANQPITEQGQMDGSAMQDQQRPKSAQPGSSMLTQHGTMTTALGMQAGGMKPDSKPVVPPDTGSRHDSQGGSQGSQHSQQQLGLNVPQVNL